MKQSKICWFPDHYQQHHGHHIPNPYDVPEIDVPVEEQRTILLMNPLMFVLPAQKGKRRVTTTLRNAAWYANGFLHAAVGTSLAYIAALRRSRMSARSE